MTSDQLMTVNKGAFSKMPTPGTPPEKGQAHRATESRLCGTVSFARIHTNTHAVRPSQCRFCSALLTERIPPLQAFIKKLGAAVRKEPFRERAQKKQCIS